MEGSATSSLPHCTWQLAICWQDLYALEIKRYPNCLYVIQRCVVELNSLMCHRYSRYQVIERSIVLNVMNTEFVCIYVYSM